MTLGDNSEQASGQDPQTPDPARAVDSKAEPDSSAESSEKIADCREDALSDRDSDDPEEALADDGCLGVLDEGGNDP